MAEHEHTYRHDHEGDAEPHNHDEEPADNRGVTGEGAGSSSTDEQLAEHAIDAVEAVAEHAMDALVEAHRDEEETERVEAQAEAVEAVVTALAEAPAEGEPAGDGDVVQGGDDEGHYEEGHEEEGEHGHEGEDTAAPDVVSVVPPQPEEEREAAGVGAERRRSVSRFRGHRGRRVR